MSNFAALIQSLVISGSRKSDGTANAGGLVYAYLPDTSTSVNLYADASAETIVTQPITLDAGGRISRSDYPDGVFCKQAVRLVVQTSDGTMVSDSVYVPSTAGATGYDPDQTNAAFTRTNVNDILQDAGLSFGGLDWKYKESGGATSRTVKAKFADGGISVKDFGAVGDGVAIDTTAFQAAFSRAKALSCNVLVPAGTYKTDQAITMTSATGVKVIGQGRDTTIIKPTHGTANAFTFTACASGGISGMSILHTSGSTGAAIAVGGASPNFKAEDIYVPANGTYVGFSYAMDFSGASDFDQIAYCDLNADLVGLRANCTSSSKPGILIGCQIGASSAAPVSPTSGIEFNGSNGNYYILGCRAYGATNNILFNASWTGTVVRIYGGDVSAVLGSTPLNMSGLAADRDVRFVNCGVDGYTVNVAAGTAAIDRSQGRHIRVRGTAVAALAIGAPTPAPSLGSTRDLDLFISVFSNAGADVTSWTFNAGAYKVSAQPSITNLNITSYHFKWDADASVWREFARSVTT